MHYSNIVSKHIRDVHACVSLKVNAEMTGLYWQVGNTINEVFSVPHTPINRREFS